MVLPRDPAGTIVLCWQHNTCHIVSGVTVICYPVLKAPVTERRPYPGQTLNENEKGKRNREKGKKEKNNVRVFEEVERAPFKKGQVVVRRDMRR